MRPCFSFSNLAASNDKPAVLSIFEEIGFWGVQAKDFVGELGKVEGKQIHVEISSPGGDVAAALTMYNALRASGKEVVTKVMGVAASAASLIFMAGDKRVMPKNTQLMVHNPWTFAAGNADELEETAATLRKIGASLKATYAARSGMDDAELDAMLAKDTWINADEALTMGFATEVIEEVKAKALFDLTRADLPAAVRAAAYGEPAPVADPVVDPVVEPVEAFGDQVVTLAKAAGFESHAGAWVLAFTKESDVVAAINVAREVKALCSAVGKAEQADKFIKGGKSVDEVRASLAAEMAKGDEHIDTTTRNSNQPTNLASARSAVKTADIWAKRRQSK